MRKVLPMSRIREMEPYMDAKVLDYIHEGQIEAFEGFEDFDLIAFDWYDVRSERTAASQMLLYLDREDLFVFCEDDAAEDAAQAALLVPGGYGPSGPAGGGHHRWGDRGAHRCP